MFEISVSVCVEYDGEWLDVEIGNSGKYLGVVDREHLGNNYGIWFGMGPYGSI